MKYYEHNSYKELILWLIESGDFKRGVFKRLAEDLLVQPVIVSQVLKGDRDFTTDQGVLITDFFGLTKIQSEFFMALLDENKSSNHRAKSYLQDRINNIRKEAQKISKRVGKFTKLTEEQKAEFYSTWIYAAIRMVCSLEEKINLSVIAQKLNMEIKVLEHYVNNLLSWGLIEETEEGGYKIGALSTHISDEDPLVKSHWNNWRMKGMQQINSYQKNRDLFFSTAVSLSEEDALKVRQLLLDFIEDCKKIVIPSKAEKVFAINLDLFNVVD